jgi:hypothetical protein
VIPSRINAASAGSLIRLPPESATYSIGVAID